MQHTILFIGTADSKILELIEFLGAFFDITSKSLKEVRGFSDAEYYPYHMILTTSECQLSDDYLTLLEQHEVVLRAVPLMCLESCVPPEDERFTIMHKILERGAHSYFQRPFYPELIQMQMNSVLQLKSNSFKKYSGIASNMILDYHDTHTTTPFWSTEALDSILKPSCKGAACISEFNENRLSVIRYNKEFSEEMMGSKQHPLKELTLKLSDFMDQDNLLFLWRTIINSQEVGDYDSRDLLLQNVAGIPKVYIHITVRLIERKNDRKLFLCNLENTTKSQLEHIRSSQVAEYLSLLLQNMHGGVTATSFEDGQMTYLYSNDVFYEMFGYTREQFEKELPGSIYPRIFEEDRDNVYQKLHNKVLEDSPVELEVRFLKRDGSMIWVRISNSAHHIESIDPPVYFTVYNDISKEREFTDRLHMINSRLGHSEIFFKIDLTARKLLDYHSVYAPADFDSNTLTASYEDLMLNGIYAEDKSSIRKELSYEGLIAKYQKGETRLSYEYRRHLPDSEVHWFAATVILYNNNTDNTINALIYSHDIDSRMKRRLAKDRIIDNDVDEITILNIKKQTAQVVKVCNGCTINIGTSSYGDNIEQYIEHEVVSEDKKNCRNFFRIENLIRLVDSQGYADYSYWLWTNGGSNRRMNAHVTYLDSTQDDLLLVGRDITTLFEEEMERQIVLQQAVDMANYANQAKSDFLSRMSHDMRTPLNAILGVTELAKNETTTPQITKYLESIDVSGKYLLGLINDTLDLSKIESGKMEFNREPYTLSEFLLGINTVIRPLMEERKIQFDIHLCNQTRNISVDKMRFNQIFYNLLSNAAKYTDEGGRVEFYSEPIPMKDQKTGMRFHVKDNGIGMSKDYQKVLFEPFTRETRVVLSERKGTGLGLAIVKRIIDLTGGSIQVISNIGEGTEFIVDLYAQELAFTHEDKVCAEKNLDRINGIHILLVDDTQINALIFKKILEYKGCHVDTVFNGQEAVDCFKASPIDSYDIILTDLRMPVMDGLEEARQIRALDRPDAKVIPIIAATADAYNDIMEKITQAGMNMRLVKPIQPEELFDAILQLLEEKDSKK